MLSDRSQTQKDTQCVIPLMGNVQNRQIHRVREWVPGFQGLGRGIGECLMGTVSNSQDEEVQDGCGGGRGAVVAQRRECT